MQPPFPSPTPTWHNDIYPAIDPSTRPGSHSGQTIIITGAGSGIGRSTAKAFVTAGAKNLVLIGRTAATLEETKSTLGSSVNVTTFVADVADEDAVRQIAESVGQWDVLVLNAGYMSTPAPVAKTNIEDYWKAYETNVKSTIIFAKYFFPTANPERAAALAVISGSIVLPTKMLLGLSAYQNSKLAVIKTMEYLSLENPNIFCAAVHPGMVDTDVFRKSGATPDMLPMDNANLPAGFMVWVTLPEAQFLNGKFVWVNWDVEELKAKADEIAGSSQLTAGIYGWPFPHVASPPEQ